MKKGKGWYICFSGGKDIDSTLKLGMSPHIRARLLNKLLLRNGGLGFFLLGHLSVTSNPVSVISRSYNLIILKTFLE